MEISPYMLSLLLLYSLAFGVSAGVLNDVNRMLRVALGMRDGKGDSASRVRRRVRSILSILFIALQDILLFGYIGVGVAVLNYYLNRGIFRIYSIGATVLGFALYYFTVGRLVMRLAEAMIRILRALMVKIFKIVTFPIRFAFGLLTLPIKKLCEKIRFALAKRRIMRYNKIKREELIALAARGFALDGQSPEREKK